MTDVDVDIDNPLDGPAQAPPPGITANFTDPSNLNIYVHASLSIFLTLSTIAVAGRVYARWVYLKCAHLGDYLLVISYLLYLACVALVWKMTEFPGFFVHQWDFLVRDLIPFLRVRQSENVVLIKPKANESQLTFIVGNVFVVFLPTLKVAICLEWIYLFSPAGTRNFVFWASHLVIWANVVFYFITLVLYSIACDPSEHFWNQHFPSSCTRANRTKITFAGAIINFVSDIIIFIIPQRTIWNLHMPIKKRLRGSVAFAVGIFAVAAATARLVFNKKRTHTIDYTYTFSAVAMAALAEGLCGFLVMCIPAIPKAYVGMKIPQLLAAVRSNKRNNTEPSSSHPSTIRPSKERAHMYIDIDGCEAPLSEVHALESIDSSRTRSTSSHPKNQP
ncbi:hypothetical protein F5Y10DRAFT_264944 [Nemania abortiva]|nr:hypothetical protein F5Y10DRAFT_264944 [Nemania abortiva]